jgi:hypothetical protein
MLSVRTTYRILLQVGMVLGGGCPCLYRQWITDWCECAVSVDWNSGTPSVDGMFILCLVESDERY